MRGVREWLAVQRAAHPELLRIGVFGSYARNDAGVGSDLDLVAVVRSAAEPFHRRSAGWDLTPLPVPADLLVYTDAEWSALLKRGGRFAAMLGSETQWLEAAASG
jgi:Nucleotidyltransferase domain